MNKVVIIGRLTKDPELRFTPNGTSVCNITIAVDRPRAKDGQETADFIPCTVWGKSAENLAKYMSKGRQVAVDGRIEISSYEKDGTKHWRTDVVANSVEFLGSSNQGRQQEEQERTVYNNAGQPIGQEMQWGSDLPFM